jgi:hypothetical protein
METKSFRSRTFLRAYEIMRESGESFGRSLASAWKLYDLTKKLKQHLVKFAYQKKDGSIREAIGTLNFENKDFANVRDISNKVINYFDVEADGFRCFKVANFIGLA